MGKDSKIAWTNYTASPWFGCTEVDLCCTNCYSRELTKNKFGYQNGAAPSIMRRAYKAAGFQDWATRPVWGDKATRVRSKGFWTEVHKWNRQAAQADEPPRIFTSLIDWLDTMPAGIVDLQGNVLNRVQVFADFLAVIGETESLDWLLLTKRPENFLGAIDEVLESNDITIPAAMENWLEDWRDGKPPHNVWFGWTAGTAKEWKTRHDLSWMIPARVHWVSAEPLLEELSFNDIALDPAVPNSHNINWIVIGGESGPKRRDCGVEMINNLARAAQHAGVSVYVKQDCHLLPGQQGRIPEDVWALKNFPA